MDHKENPIIRFHQSLLFNEKQFKTDAPIDVISFIYFSGGNITQCQRQISTISFRRYKGIIRSLPDSNIELHDAVLTS